MRANAAQYFSKLASAMEESAVKESFEEKHVEDGAVNGVLAGQLAALQKEDRKEHSDVIRRDLGDKFNYDEEVAIESGPEAKTPVNRSKTGDKPEPRHYQTQHKSEISGPAEIVQPAITAPKKDDGEYADDFITEKGDKILSRGNFIFNSPYK